MTEEKTSICLHGHLQTRSALPDQRFFLQQNKRTALAVLVTLAEQICTKQQQNQEGERKGDKQK